MHATRQWGQLGYMYRCVVMYVLMTSLTPGSCLAVPLSVSLLVCLSRMHATNSKAKRRRKIKNWCERFPWTEVTGVPIFSLNVKTYETWSPDVGDKVSRKWTRVPRVNTARVTRTLFMHP